jgi:acid phosphatase (class A)
VPATARLLADVRHDEKLAAIKAKTFYLRKRPWIVDPTLEPCAKGDKPLSSYPSGHATMGYSMAVVLAAALPSKAPAIMARAGDYAESRLVCGVHFRSDVVAGRILGEEMGRRLLAKPAFKAEEAAAAQELRALR